MLGTNAVDIVLTVVVMVVVFGSQVMHNSFSRKYEATTNPCVGDILVSVLPCWHIFERTAEYWMMSKGTTLVYSSVKNFKSDLLKVSQSRRS